MIIAIAIIIGSVIIAYAIKPNECKCKPEYNISPFTTSTKMAEIVKKEDPTEEFLKANFKE